MDIAEIAQGTPIYDEVLALRYSIFFEPYGLPKDVTADEMESGSTHVVITENESLIAYGRLSPLGKDEYRISQIVVDPKQQGRGISTILLKHLIKVAADLGACRIRLGAQASAQRLYEKLGFKAVSETYIVELTGIPHVKMAYEVDT